MVNCCLLYYKYGKAIFYILGFHIMLYRCKCFTRKYNQWHICEDTDDVIYRFLHWIFIIKRKLHGGLKIWIFRMNFIFSRWKQYFTHSRFSFVKYCFHHSKITSISSRHRVISSMYVECITYIFIYKYKM